MDEEGARFRTALLGSRAFVGEDLTELADRRDPGGVTLRDAMTEAGFSFDRLPEAVAIESVGAYLELHIEQGRVLESAGAGIGIVTGLAGMFGMRATFRGRADHAGTTPMNDRRDALVGASRAVVALRDHATRHPGLLRMTVGTMSVQPGGFNIVPVLCEFSIDVRAERRRRPRRRAGVDHCAAGGDRAATRISSWISGAPMASRPTTSTSTSSPRCGRRRTRRARRRST